MTSKTRLGPPGAGQEPPERPKCAYCQRRALAPGYTAPPLCEKHLVMRIIAHYLKRNQRPVTVETIAQFVAENRQTQIWPDEVAALLKPMQEGGDPCCVTAR